MTFEAVNLVIIGAFQHLFLSVTEPLNDWRLLAYSSAGKGSKGVLFPLTSCPNGQTIIAFVLLTFSLTFTYTDYLGPVILVHKFAT
jgi:hypothetical protein